MFMTDNNLYIFSNNNINVVIILNVHTITRKDHNMIIQNSIIYNA